MKTAFCALMVIGSICAIGQIRTMKLDAKNNALLLTSSNAKMIGNLTAGQPYSVKVTANSVQAPMQGAFFVMQDSTEVSCRYVASGQSFIYVPISSSYQMAAFYVDWSTTADNSGTVTVDIKGPTTQSLVINAQSNAILLDNVTTIVGGLSPTKKYVVSVRDSALYGVLETGVFFMYQDSSGTMGFKYVKPGDAFTFVPSSYTSYQLAPLYVDWSTTSDNQGAVIVDVVPQDDVTRTMKLDAKNNALLLTSSNAKMIGNLTAGQPYSVKVTANSVQAPMQGAFFVMQDSTEVSCRYVASGQSFIYVPISSSYQMAAFYVDWSTTADNSGTVTVDIKGPTTQSLVINAQSNAILLDNVTTIVGGLSPTKKYVVSVRDSALYGVLETGVFFMYQDSSGTMGFKYVKPGDAFTFVPSSYTSYQLAPLYVDWSTTSDNQGAVIVDVVPVTQTATSILDASTAKIPFEFSLSQNYPNPFNPSTTIEYGLPTESHVKLRIFNILGQVVAEFVNDAQVAGYNRIFWNANVASGLYFYRLEAVSVGNSGKRFVNVKKMILLK